MKEESIYKSVEGKEGLEVLYNKAIAQLDVDIDSHYIETRHGTTHVLVTGPADGEQVVILQGGNTVNPLTLSWFRPLLDEFQVIAPDTIGHPGLSSENRLSPTDGSFGDWLVDILDQFNIQRAILVAPSYGAGIILRTAAYHPERISKAVLVVPSGIASGSMARMMFKVVFPMLMYRAFPSERRLKRAVQPMLSDGIDELSLEVIGAVFRFVKLETKMPKHTTIEELKGFEAPVMVFTAERDIFFPANVINQRVKEIIPNLVAIETLRGDGHFPSRASMELINKRVSSFIRGR
jgi:pimeloyl-ACP methyl ester carboxylesterase